MPDVNEMNPQEFILSLQPPDNLSKYFDQAPCIEDLDNLSGEIDLDKLYNNYKSCKVRKNNYFIWIQFFIVNYFFFYRTIQES